MANEYLQRTPTSTGNRKVFTISVWYKKSLDNTTVSNGQQTLLRSGDTLLRFDTNSNEDDKIRFYAENASATNILNLITGSLYRDSSNWTHILANFNSTQSTDVDRASIYVNGVKLTEFTTATKPSINELTEFFIRGTAVNLGVGVSGEYFKGQLFDYFVIDGQALTPDVFGFYKEGKGYQSSGTKNATDFRPGQWVPKAPRTIKTEINRKGGFGVNGFYLPMNDSSNFGADFHCTPNSIIKLKGEDLPQPRNGAPTTTDAYVSQLRSDPYAANLVLAVPGISTATGANLVTNGTFDSNVSNWTASNSTTAWENGQLKITRTAGGGLTANQAFTTETGKRYTISGTINSSTSRGDLRVYNGSGISGSMIINISGTNGAVTDLTGSFTATSTTSTVVIAIDNNNGVVYVDNVVVKQEDVPRDYSADIKGSGTNKTLTANGNAGVGYEISGYYGSALSFGGSSHYFDAGNSSDFDFGSGDFTIEYWQNSNSFASTPGLGIWDNVNNQRSWLIYQNSSGLARFYTSVDGTSSVAINATGTIPTNQWNHFCMERNGSNLVGYVNGVCVGVNPNLGTQSLFTPADPFLIGKWDTSYYIDGEIQDLRVYKGVAKYKGGFDVPKPYTPIGIESWRQVPDTCKNNFATFNPNFGVGRQDQLTYSNGNLRVVSAATGGSDTTASSSIAIKGKIYCEFYLTDDGLGAYVGIMKYNTSLTNNGIDTTANSDCWLIRGDNEHKSNGEGVNGISYGSGSFATGDIIMVAVDIDNTSIWFGKNGTWYASGDPASNSNAAYTNLPSTEDLLVMCGDNYSSETPTIDVNFGQNPTFSGSLTAGTYTDANGKGLFKYQPPAGYLALCEDNLPTPAIADPGEHFKTVLWTGDGNGGRSITDVGFKPDLVWVKRRSATAIHFLFDSVRGAGAYLQSSSDVAELVDATNTLMSFDSDGFTSGNTNGMNQNTHNYVAWCWKAGGAAVSNTDGSITSQVSVNQTAGFSIVSFTSTSSGNFTIGHGLGKTPKLIITKERGATNNWHVWHSDVMTTSSQFLMLNSTAALGSYSTVWGTSIPTSLVFGATVGSLVNASTASIAYCWTEIEGYSKFGSYEGNGNADGPFVYCGFKPAFVLIKTTSGGSWVIKDSSRNTTNPNGSQLYANTSAVDDDPYGITDFLSNGFKPRVNSQSVNASGETYIFAAFAESPFQTASAK